MGVVCPPAAARVVVVDDEEGTRWVLRRAFERAGWGVVATEEPGRVFDLLDEGGADLILLDVRLGDHDGLDLLTRLRARYPATPVVMITAYGTMETAIEAMKRGAYDYLVKPMDLGEIAAVARRALGARSQRAERGDPSASVVAESVVGKSPCMQETFKMVGRVAATDATVLIQGESGTGKELVARAIHRHSQRAAGPLVAVDCAAIPCNLLESELFGHERGAFTGAFTRRRGRFELAESGTIFLDEVGELPVDLQAKLLRVLQERAVQRVGGADPIEVDVRVIAATNRDLRTLGQEGRFREDLYYRLNVLSLTLSPLRDRREDIPALVEHFLAKYEPKLGRREVSSEAMDVLLRHGWPGNVRELENVIHRAMVLVPADVIGVGDLPEELVHDLGQNPEAESLDRLVERQLKGFIQALRGTGRGKLYHTVFNLVERPLLEVVLRETGGNQLRAARLLGINRNTLRKRIQALGIVALRNEVDDAGSETPRRRDGPRDELRRRAPSPIRGSVIKRGPMMTPTDGISPATDRGREVADLRFIDLPDHRGGEA